jgi:hypothetical protein
MKRFIYITVAFMVMLVFIGCATTTPEQRKETYDMRKEVGNSQFVGSSSNNLDARGMMPHLAY